MVDDYSFPDPTFDYDNFSKWHDSHRFTPDLLFRESQLLPVCDEVIRLIENDRLKNHIIDYVKSRRYPCSLFIAAWYLLRLGKLKSQIFPPELISSSIFNILPESYKPFEEKAIEIIKSTPYADTTDLIHYKYLDGRLIA